MAMTLRLLWPSRDEDLAAWSQRNEGYEFERAADGTVIVTPAWTLAGWRKGKLGGQLGVWADQHGGITFSATTGFHLPDGSLLVPAASWLSRPRWNALADVEKNGFPPLCPEAAFELPLQAADVPLLRTKIRAYIANGAKIAVLVDPHDRNVEIHRPGRDPEIHANPAVVPLDPELPGFVLDLGLIFAP